MKKPIFSPMNWPASGLVTDPSGAGVAEKISGPLADLLVPDPEDVRGLADRLRAWRADLDHYRQATAPLAEALRQHTWDFMAQEFVAAAEAARP